MNPSLISFSFVLNEFALTHNTFSKIFVENISARVHFFVLIVLIFVIIQKYKHNIYKNKNYLNKQFKFFFGGISDTKGIEFELVMSCIFPSTQEPIASLTPHEFLTNSRLLARAWISESFCEKVYTQLIDQSRLDYFH